LLVHTRPRDEREASMSIIEDIGDIREIYGHPAERSVKKQLPKLEKHSRAFIALSPFIVMATCDAEGRCDASPKGDAPGFVQVLDDETLLIPDRLGNNRVDSIGNLLKSPGIGLIFFVPGLRETLRVNGRAQITTDPALLEPCTVEGKVPRSGILITAEEVYFHCGKALIRSDLWNPEKHIAQKDFPSLGIIINEQIGGNLSPEDAARQTAESYRTRLY
jgi:PPOX class probable FMN-dependent enzyme